MLNAEKYLKVLIIETYYFGFILNEREISLPIFLKLLMSVNF